MLLDITTHQLVLFDAFRPAFALLLHPSLPIGFGDPAKIVSGFGAMARWAGRSPIVSMIEAAERQTDDMVHFDGFFAKGFAASEAKATLRAEPFSAQPSGRFSPQACRNRAELSLPFRRVSFI